MSQQEIRDGLADHLRNPQVVTLDIPDEVQRIAAKVDAGQPVDIEPGGYQAIDLKPYLDQHRRDVHAMAEATDIPPNQTIDGRPMTTTDERCNCGHHRNMHAYGRGLANAFCATLLCPCQHYTPTPSTPSTPSTHPKTQVGPALRQQPGPAANPYSTGADMPDHTHTPQPVGPLLDALGCNLHLFDGDLPYGAIVLLAVNGVDGNVLRTAHTDGLDWLTLRGLLTSANDLATAGWPDHRD